MFVLETKKKVFACLFHLGKFFWNSISGKKRDSNKNFRLETYFSP